MSLAGQGAQGPQKRQTLPQEFVESLSLEILIFKNMFLGNLLQVSLLEREG